jgi:hypothetical protein
MPILWRSPTAASGTARVEAEMKTSSRAARSRGVLLLALPFLVLAAASARAAPQILGIVASNGLATPLHCENGYCSAYLASFCLQEERYAPRRGHDYRLASGGSLTIITQTKDGAQLRIPAERLLNITANAGFTSVRVGVAQEKLAALGAGPAAVEVGPETTILPLATNHDPDPQSAEEITTATGPLRRLATRTFDGAGPTADAARLIGLVINDLPGRKDMEPESLAALWDGVAAEGRRHGLSPEGIGTAAGIMAECQGTSAEDSRFWSEVCLKMREAELMTRLNRKYWDEAAGGS